MADRTAVYRHAHAFFLFDKRRTNVRAALERIIEKAGDVEVTASAVVAAIQAYSKINSVGQWIDPSEQVGMRDLFERMTTQTRACNDAIGYAQKLSHPFSEALALVFASSVDQVLRDRRNDR